MDTQGAGPSLTSGTHETIESVADLDRAATRGLSTHQRWIERAASAFGRPRAVYLVLAFVALWIVVNGVLNIHGRAFDPPPFAYLESIISLAALMMTIIILTTDNRINVHDALRDRLDLQVNLLNERKISKVIELLEALRRDSPTLPNRHDQEASEMGRAVDTAAIVRAIDERMPGID